MILKLIIFFLIINPVLTGQGFPANRQIILSQNEQDLLFQNEIIVRELSPAGARGRTLEAVALFPASLDAVYEVIIDFKDYPDFMPNIANVEILNSNHSSAILNYTISLPLKKIKKYRLELSYWINNNTALITWAMVPWPELSETETISNTEGYWLVKNYPEKEGHVIVLYHAYTDPGEIPLGLGWIIDILTNHSIPTILLNTRERVYSRPD
ncbi:MAG: SRPBCC family protein [Candidatus Neomarinimicrobiota bacterium]